MRLPGSVVKTLISQMYNSHDCCPGCNGQPVALNTAMCGSASGLVLQKVHAVQSALLTQELTSHLHSRVQARSRAALRAGSPVSVACTSSITSLVAARHTPFRPGSAVPPATLLPS